MSTLTTHKRDVAKYYLLNENDKNVLDITDMSLNEIMMDLSKSSNNYDAIISGKPINRFLKNDDVLQLLTKKCNKIIFAYDNNQKSRIMSVDCICDFFNKNGFVKTDYNDNYGQSYLYYCFKKAKPSTLIENIDCTGCGACESVCPKNAITIKIGCNGYLKPQLNDKLCTECKQCIQICPILKRPQKNELPLSCFACQASDVIREKSSSGGVFGVLSQQILANGGVIYAAKWKDGEVVLDRCDCISELDLFRKSKYVQANPNYVYAKIIKDLKEGKKVLFVGCPCQVAAVNNIVPDKLQENILTIDLLCNYAPSPGILKKYVEETYGSDFEYIDYRFGKWGDFSNKIHLKNGELYKNEKSDDELIRAINRFKEPSVLINSVCVNCKFARIPRQGDITIGDFWKINSFVKDFGDDLGTSIVLVNTHKGNLFFSKCISGFKRVEEVNAELAINTNRFNRKNSLKTHDRFFELSKVYSINDALTIEKEGRYDIGLVGWWVDNYGTNLTNYALYRYLNKKGYSVYLINHPKHKKSIFTRFSKTPVKKYDMGPIETESELRLLNDKCSVFILGSDQVFRPSFIKDVNCYTLMDWVENKFSMTYASSFGVTTINEDHNFKKTIHYNLSKINAVSVRESEAKKILKSVFDIESKLVVDPVFLISADEYKQFECVPVSKEKYVAAYILDESETKLKILMFVKKQLDVNDCKVICEKGKLSRFDTIQDSVIEDATIEEWLSMIDNSDYLITDSFHGLCFAIIMKKQFLIVYDDAQWRGKNRFETLLQYLDLEDRWIQSYDEKNIKTILTKEIDYNTVTAKLSVIVSESEKWLLSNIDRGLKYRAPPDYSDVSVDHFNCVNEQILNLKNQVNELEMIVNFLLPLVSNDVYTISDKLRKNTTLEEYLEEIKSLKSTLQIMLSVAGDGNKIIKKIGWSGLSNIDLDYRNAFVGMITDDKSEFAKGEKYATLTDNCNSELSVKSFGYQNVKNLGRSIFVVGLKEYIVDELGLNILIYHKPSNVVIDITNVCLQKDNVCIKHINPWNSRKAGE